jgi:hypothetical protein
MNWKDLPRTADKVAIVGFHDATRDLAPYESMEYEIWGVNEEYRFPWLKRLDRHFQLHPRWDFTRTNNLNDPNHLFWLQNKTGTCNFCKGVGVAGDSPCPYCEKGTYTPPPNRTVIPIYMQKEWDDIPNSVELPLKEMSDTFLPTGKLYYTSSCAYQLVLAMLMGFKRIEFYGYDMGTKTEYHYQRANFEYLIGLAHGRGFDVVLPQSHILTGELYGYTNMKTGYRQQLEMRVGVLNSQFNEVKTKCTRLEAQLDYLNSIRDKEEIDFKEAINNVKLELMKAQGKLNFINGTITETKNLTSLYDSYFNVEMEPENGEVSAYKDNELFVTARYITKDEEDAQKKNLS